MSSITCGLSKEIPEEPVLSLVSHCVFERYLIEQYINEHGTDPINGQPLTKEQLLNIIKNDEPQRIIVRSMPQLLKVLHEEWERANKEREKLEIREDGKNEIGQLVDSRVLQVLNKSCREAHTGNVQVWYNPWHAILEKLFPVSAGYLVSREFNGLCGLGLLVVSRHVAGTDPRVVLLGAGTQSVLPHHDKGTKTMLASCMEAVASDYMNNGVACQRVYWLGFMEPRCGWGWIEGGQVVKRVEGFWDPLQTEESQQHMQEMGDHLREFIE